METTFSTKCAAMLKSVTDNFASIVSTVTDKLKSASTETTTKLGEMETTFSTKASAMQTSITNAFTSIESTITDKLKTASTNASTKCGEIETTINNLKDKLSKIEWNIPELKMPVKLPEYKVSGKWEFDDDGNPTKAPKITVEWYRLAAKMGALFNEPTIVGVGDASQPEMLIGEDTLYNSIRAAVMDSNGGGLNQTNNITVQDTDTAAETARRIRNETRLILARMRGGV